MKRSYERVEDNLLESCDNIILIEDEETSSASNNRKIQDICGIILEYNPNIKISNPYKECLANLTPSAQELHNRCYIALHKIRNEENGYERYVGCSKEALNGLIQSIESICQKNKRHFGEKSMHEGCVEMRQHTALLCLLSIIYELDIKNIKEKLSVNAMLKRFEGRVISTLLHMLEFSCFDYCYTPANKRYNKDIIISLRLKEESSAKILSIKNEIIKTIFEKGTLDKRIILSIASGDSGSKRLINQADQTIFNMSRRDPKKDYLLKYQEPQNTIINTLPSRLLDNHIINDVPIINNSNTSSYGTQYNNQIYISNVSLPNQSTLTVIHEQLPMSTNNTSKDICGIILEYNPNIRISNPYKECLANLTPSAQELHNKCYIILHKIRNEENGYERYVGCSKEAFDNLVQNINATYQKYGSKKNPTNEKCVEIRHNIALLCLLSIIYEFNIRATKEKLTIATQAKSFENRVISTLLYMLQFDYFDYCYKSWDGRYDQSIIENLGLEKKSDHKILEIKKVIINAILKKGIIDKKIILNIASGNTGSKNLLDKADQTIFNMSRRDLNKDYLLEYQVPQDIVENNSSDLAFDYPATSICSIILDYNPNIKISSRYKECLANLTPSAQELHNKCYIILHKIRNEENGYERYVGCSKEALNGLIENIDSACQKYKSRAGEKTMNEGCVEMRQHTALLCLLSIIYEFNIKNIKEKLGIAKTTSRFEGRVISTLLYMLQFDYFDHCYKTLDGRCNKDIITYLGFVEKSSNKIYQAKKVITDAILKKGIIDKKIILNIGNGITGIKNLLNKADKKIFDMSNRGLNQNYLLEYQASQSIMTQAPISNVSLPNQSIPIVAHEQLPVGYNDNIPQALEAIIPIQQVTNVESILSQKCNKLFDILYVDELITYRKKAALLDSITYHYFRCNYEMYTMLSSNVQQILVPYYPTFWTKTNCLMLVIDMLTANIHQSFIVNNVQMDPNIYYQCSNLLKERYTFQNVLHKSIDDLKIVFDMLQDLCNNNITVNSFV